ncbi:hypothetical protein WICPIJ_009195 [Wickerhamomyces pijperi]|uniref:PABS domain-containing protein n=1 Tax=Wickerhamomyces pijperi TaxID=599730 RepID=A0A9P8TF29_WICPI|nr:hypothetical protein WICPIJ_009195 [Wickerhamomyces pijperi]
MTQDIEQTQLTHPTIKDGWFREISDSSFPGQALALKVDRILDIVKSPFQDILVFKSTDYGNVLVLDGIIQLTERDEFAYQEMITHLPLMSHPNPKRVLIIGGGDGGVIREALKHKDVEKIVLVEIDETVIRLSKEYLPHMSSGFDDKRVEVHLGDGFKYLENLQAAESSNKFDVIITDSSDPEGPAVAFFQKTYFTLLSNALSDSNGIVITQASENVWLDINKLRELKSCISEVFPVVNCSYCMVPTYTSGQLGLMIASKNKEANLKTPTRSLPRKMENELFRYYNKEMHKSSFVLPNWAANFLGEE